MRTGSFFPSLIERRRRIDRALFAVVIEAYVHGVSTHSVDDLVKALGADSGISKSEVSRICGERDEELTAFKERPLDHTVFPYVFLDATYCKARVNHRIVSQAVVIATGISATGHREILGLMAGDSESKAFWTKFLRSLRDRGLDNVQLVISDSHSGLVAAIRAVFLGAARQRCRVHFVRDVFSVIEKRSTEMVAATIRTIFAQTTAEAVRTQLNVVADMLGRQFPQVKTMPLDAATDITAFADFPPAHWKKIWSTNPLERLNREVKRRADVVQVFPNPAALDRLAVAVLAELHDEWQVFDRRYLSEGSVAELFTANPTEDDPQLRALTPDLGHTRHWILRIRERTSRGHEALPAGVQGRRGRAVPVAPWSNDQAGRRRFWESTRRRCGTGYGRPGRTGRGDVGRRCRRSRPRR
ncbi:IS256 family transposase [Streptomyces plumbiresistens]|uniref:Mutator family transposase n=1 Tax=Streptomyces plumbiresistens TaxID=511811 RepID=A0ABP7QNS6_9ACTN